MAMSTIWKYNIPPTDNPVNISIPKGSIIVHVGQQDGTPTIWALVDPQNPLEQRTFVVVGTGHPIDGRDAYLGTALCDPFVWHIMKREE